jgi:hypothetical protein
MAEETNTEVAPEVPAVKPGYKTTEFWLSLAACVLGAFVTSGVLPDENVSMKIAGICLAGLTTLGYTISRFVVKSS